MSVALAPHAPSRYKVDEKRGPAGMLLFIATEAMLFVMLFFAYFYLGHGNPNWAAEPPKLLLAFVMLAVLLSSSAVLRWGEHRVEAGDVLAARGALAGTILLGVAFLVIQSFEYADRLKEIRPTTDAYGSMFFAITSLHGAHVVLGVLMLAYVLVLPRIGHTDKPPHRPMHTASLYWHFVDLVWVFIVALLYVMPNLEH